MDISLHYQHGKCQFLIEKAEISTIIEEEVVLDEDFVVEVECQEMILERDK